jgi:hypothetical protein
LCEINKAAKLTEANVSLIRAQLAAGKRYIDIAADFGVKKSQIGNIATGKNWKHVI